MVSIVIFRRIDPSSNPGGMFDHLSKLCQVLGSHGSQIKALVFRLIFVFKYGSEKEQTEDSETKEKL